LYADAAPVKAWQVQVRAATSNVSQQWLTVFDLSPSAANVATALPVTVVQGAIVGVQLPASDGNSVVISSAGAAGTPIAGSIGYSVAAVAAHHIITELAPSTGYTVAVSTSGNVQTVRVSVGGTTMSSAKGVLDFSVNAAGTPTPTPSPTPTPTPTPGTPVANFGFVASGLAVTFTDSSTDTGGSISSHSWTFGDGSTSTATSPSHTYAAAGTYSVTETVTDSVSGKTSSKTASVTVASTGGTPAANFTNSVSGLTAAFTDTSTDSGGSIGSHAWTFGDGSTSSVASPSHTYAKAGTYSVTETVADKVSGKTSSKTASVTVSSSASSTQLLGNTGFENGGAVSPWSMTAGVLCNSSICKSEVAHTGTWFAGVSGWGTTHTDTLSQVVTIPSGKTKATLSYYLHIDTAETTTTAVNDKLKLQVLNSAGTVLSTLATYSNLNAAKGYTVHTSNLAAYIGQKVTIKFTGSENSSKQTSFVLDDITLTVQ
jgi:PKD repeat protein